MKKKIMTTRDVKSIKTKENLFKALRKLYKKYGCESLTVRNICEEAKVSIGSFYHHYDSKDELVIHFYYEEYKRFLKENKFEQGKSIEETIINICMNYGAYCKSLGVDFIVFTTRSKETNNSLFLDEDIDGLPTDKEVREKYDKELKNGNLKEDISFDEMTYDICILRRAVLLEWCLKEGKCDIEELMKKFCKIYLHSIFN